MSTSLNKFIASLKRPITRIHSVVLLIALGLYLAGATYFLLPILIASLALNFPFPALVRSLYGRLVIAVLIFYALFQAAAVVKFLLMPNASFGALAIIVTLLALVVPYAFGTKTNKVLITRNDIYATLAAFMFVVPLAVYCLGPNGNYHTTAIGGIQAIDGANHSSFIAKAVNDQGILYTRGDNYPNAYHVTTAFVNDSYGLTEPALTWSASLKLYVLQYLSLGFLLLFTAYYLVMSVARGLGKPKESDDQYGLAAAFGVALPLIGLYMLLFLYSGFLNYFYICATVLCGLLYLAESRRGSSGNAVVQDRWLATYMLLVFAASANWPLLAPAFLLTGMLYMVPTRLGLFAKTLVRKRSILMAGLLVLNILPVYFQSKYSTVTASQSLNLNGSLYGLHSLLLAFSVGLVCYVAASKRTARWLSEFVLHVFIPLFILVGVLAIYQYFTAGEIRYYVIKCAYLVEIASLVLLVAVMIDRLRESAVRHYGLVISIAVLPFVLFMFLIDTSANPFREVRGLLRSYSSEAKPPQFDNDVALYVELGEQNKLDDFNSVSLHYNFDVQKFYTHTQISYWANVLQYSADNDGRRGATESLAIYQNQLYGTFSPPEQQKLIDYINQDIAASRDSKKLFYIVTDKASYPKVAAEFGANKDVRVLYE